MKRTLILSAAAILLTALSLVYFLQRHPSRAETNVPKQYSEISEPSSKLIAAPGVIESVSEEIEVGAEIPGKLKEVSVEEGEPVARGQIVAVLENQDFIAQLNSAETNIETVRSQQETARARQAQTEADKLKIINGARPQERREAQAGFEQTIPIVENASREVERRRKLYENGDVSREEYERARRDLEVARKQSAAMREKFNVVNAEARSDDIQKADAAIQFAAAQIREFDALIKEARARVKTAEANLAKTFVRAPITGIVLRKRLKTGESVSPENTLTGIITIGDVSALRVRVDLDETDVAKIKINQTAYLTADAYGEKKFMAKVVKIGQIMGRKNIRTDAPTEKVDKKILEVLLELEPNQNLPLGLRVDAFIQLEN